MSTLREVLEGYVREGKLPEDANWQEVAEYVLKGVMPRKKVSVLDKGYVILMSASPLPIPGYGTDHRVVESARVSTAGLVDASNLGNEVRDGKLVKHLWMHHHTTPFEHQHFTVCIKCPLFVAIHLFRHRTFSFNAESHRYREPSMDFYVPSALRQQATRNRQCSTDEVVDATPDLVAKMEAHYQQSVRLYEELLASGVCREQARMVIPEAIYTTMYMTGNLRNWLHFLELRNAPDAQGETRAYAQAISSLIQPYIPMTSQAL